MNPLAQIWIALCFIVFMGIFSTLNNRERFSELENRIDQLEKSLEEEK